MVISHLSLVKAKKNSEILFALAMYNSTMYHVKEKKKDSIPMPQKKVTKSMGTLLAFTPVSP